ncbi:unnamed protein product [Miscanthus lutarioriparius]|uniref:Uncharacterized protein n=1 Tax=Miscanthus lutarioriparius TaxID=422564 RepID=A0A811P1I9_9POAL|nr:unnamed protein product [Miscanthus lutarioriparius]
MEEKPIRGDEVARSEGAGAACSIDSDLLLPRGLRFGPHKGTPINAFAVMKSGIRNIDSNGNCGPINSSKAQERMDEYINGVKRARQEHEEHEEDGEHEHYEDMEEVEQGQGSEHEQELNAKVLYDVSGSMTTHGRFAIGYGAVRAADIRAVAKENNALYERLGLAQEIPRASLRFASAVAAQGIATGSSHVGSESANDANAVDGHNEDNLNDTYRAAWETVNCHSGHHA